MKENNQEIASYTYNARGEVILLAQKDITTSRSYDEMGRILHQQTSKKNQMIYDAIYTYDDNDNLVKEKVNGKTNTYSYNEYDELIQSNKIVDGKKIETAYQYDRYGNQVIYTNNKEKINIFKYYYCKKIQHRL